MATTKKKPSKKKTTRQKPSKAGRPPGATTKSDTIYVYPGECQKCGSTERTPYKATRPIAGPVQAPNGKTYRQILIHNCKCLGCGQSRIERQPDGLIK